MEHYRLVQLIVISALFHFDFVCGQDSYDTLPYTSPPPYSSGLPFSSYQSSMVPSATSVVSEWTPTGGESSALPSLQSFQTSAAVSPGTQAQSTGEGRCQSWGDANISFVDKGKNTTYYFGEPYPLAGKEYAHAFNLVTDRSESKVRPLFAAPCEALQLASPSYRILEFRIMEKVNDPSDMWILGLWESPRPPPPQGAFFRTSNELRMRPLLYPDHTNTFQGFYLTQGRQLAALFGNDSTARNWTRLTAYTG